MAFGAQLKKCRKEVGITQAELSERTGIGKSTISEWESEKRSPDVELLPEIAAALGVLPKYLLGESGSVEQWRDEILPVRRKRVRLLGEIAAGEPLFADEDYESYVTVDEGIHCDFALRVRGDSMINARILDGDIVFIREQSDVNDGEIAAVIVDDSATLKRVYKTKKGVQLVSENPKYRPMFFDDENSDSIRILGKAVAFQSPL